MVCQISDAVQTQTIQCLPQVTCRQSDERKIAIHPRVKIPCDTKNSSSRILNPLTPQSDYHLISPYNITPESHIKVARMNETINNKRSP